DPSGYNDPSIFVFDPENGQLIKTIPVNPLPEDNETIPSIYPANLRFTRSGFGVLNVRRENASGMTWKVLDSSKNDSIYYHKDVEPEAAYSGIYSPQLTKKKRDIIGYWDSRNLIMING